MAAYYVRSSDGNNADDGSTWALAKADLHTPTWAAGDVIYVSDAHAQSTGAAVTITTNGTNASPVRIICGDDAAEPPTSLTTTATVTTTGANNLVVTGGSAYLYGITFVAGSGASSAALNINTTTAAHSRVVAESCSFQHGGTGSSSTLTFGSGSSANLIENELRNCTFKFLSTASRITINNNFRWEGGSFVSGSSTPSAGVFQISSRGGVVDVSGVDFTNLGSGVNILRISSIPCLFTIRNCKLPASWSGNLIDGTISGPGFRAEMHNCDSGDTNYRFWVEDYAGSIKQSTSVYRDGGASDGTTSISWVMATSASAEFPTIILQSPELPAIWNSTTGASKTATVHIVHDGASALNDDEIWLEVQYLGTSGFPVSSFVSDRRGLLASSAAQATSSETWTGDSGTGPNGSSTWNQLKLECTFTPQEAGYIQAKVCMAKASTTAYIDPKIVVS